MEIQSLEGSFEETLVIQNEVKKIQLTHSTTKAFLPLAPISQIQKWKTPKSGFYAPIDVRFVVTPHVSEKSGVMAVVKLIDVRDSSPARVLYQSKQFNLGCGLVIEGSQLPFCLPVGEYPLQFEVAVSRSQFKEGAKIYSTSAEWRMLFSQTPLSRVKSVMGSAQVPAMEVATNFKMRLESSRGGKGSKQTKKAINGPHRRGHPADDIGGSLSSPPEFSQSSVGSDYDVGDVDF